MNASRPRTTDRPVLALARVSRETEGAVALEYGLLTALVAVVIIAGIVAVSDGIVKLPLQSIVDALIG